MHSTLTSRHSPRRHPLTAICAFACVLFCGPTAWALITGGTGNEPLRDPGWPSGAAVLFNSPTRVAWWEGPPFGGGQWHAECRGETAAFNVVLANFAKVDLPRKRVVVHDGVGQSFWLNTNRDKDKRSQAEIDWVFMVWQPDRLKFHQELPARLRPVGKPDEIPLAQIDVYLAGRVRWADVVVPEGIELIDQRLEAHGYQPTDGVVLEGKVTDLETGLPAAATMVLEQIESRKRGGYQYTTLAEAATGDDGHWVLKHAPAGQCRVLLRAEGYVSRVIGYAQIEETPEWKEFNGGLARAGTVSGRVVDRQGKALPDVEVRIDGFTAAQSDERYELPNDTQATTDADGRFRVESLPIGKAALLIRKPGYVHPGLGPDIAVPTDDLRLEMQPAAKLQVRVDFSNAMKPANYIVEIEPEGGNRIGSWGGSGQIDGANQITYENIPAGRYRITGKPNPGRQSQATDPVVVELKGGELQEITLKAK